MHQDKEQFTQLHIIIIAFIEPVLLHCLADGTVTHQSINLPPLPHSAKTSMYCSRAFDWQALLCKCDSRISKRKSNNPFSVCICNTFFKLLQLYDGLQLHACIMYSVQDFDIHIATFQAITVFPRINSRSNNRPPPKRCPPHRPYMYMCNIKQGPLVNQLPLPRAGDTLDFK